MYLFHGIHLRLITLILLVSVATTVESKPIEFDSSRNRIIAYIIGNQLPGQHYSRTPFDDELSKTGFEIYLDQLDPRKRFLLQSDADQLGAFSTHIDDELRRGRIVLPDAGMQILNERILQVQDILEPILDDGFDPEKKEYLESDPDKIKFAANMDELRDHWRLILKMQVLNEYLIQVDKKNKQRVKENLKKAAIPATITVTPLWLEAVKMVKKRNARYLNRLLKSSRQDHYDRYFNAIAQSFDPHTNYLPPRSKEDFDIRMSGSLEGIGALLREEDGHIKVVRIIPGSASEKQGDLGPEDVILIVSEKDGEPVDISEMRIREAVGYIRGPKGSEVILTVLKSDGSRKVISIVRDVVSIEEGFVQSTILEESSGIRIGYIKIPSFYRDFSAERDGKKGRNVSDDTRNAIVKLKKDGIDTLIVDLRNDGGGALIDAVKISGMFLPGGPVVQVRDFEGNVRILEDTDTTVLYKGPLIILINQFSASASEIMAAVLQDYNRALIIGSKNSHGKGTVQAFLDLNRHLPILHFKKYDDLGALKVTIQKFYRVTGGSVQYKGVEPDIITPSIFDYSETGERHLDNPLPWSAIKPVGHEQWQGSRFNLPKVTGLSSDWIANNKIFNKIAKEALRGKERREQSRINISLSAMKRERAEAKIVKEEAIAIGLIERDDVDSDESINEEKKSLKEELDNDPTVDLSIFIMGHKDSLLK
jgi:carboxyl-terminal processing protease